MKRIGLLAFACCALFSLPEVKGLLKEPDSARGVAVDTIAWYVTTLGESCSARYRDALTLARQRYTNEKIVKYLDLALSSPVTEAFMSATPASHCGRLAQCGEKIATQISTWLSWQAR